VRYLTLHHQTYWFQIRVPVAAKARYGPLVRVDLQTSDRRTAQLLSLRLAAEWLTRFSVLAAGQEPDAEPPVGTDANHRGPDATSTADTVSKTFLREAFAYWRDLTPGRPARTLLEFESTAEMFDEIVGKPLPELSRRDIATFRDTLLADSLAAATVKKRLGFVSTMLQTQYDAGRLPTNVAQGLRVPRRHVPPPGRRGFTDEQLRAVFGSPVYAESLRPRGGGGEAAVWLPILGYGTGARLEELCQLRTADVSDHSAGGLVLRIEDDGVETRVKTASSRRLVPVHPDIISAGFGDYVRLRRQAGDIWLFPDLRADTLGSRGGNWSKWFGRYLRSPAGCGIGDRRVVFHSYRHLFKTLCRAPTLPGSDGDEGGTVLSEEVHDALTGHTGGTVSRGYGDVPLETLVAAIRRLRLPVPIPRVPAR
jgi:integrase